MIPQITLARSGLRISRLSLGTAQLHRALTRQTRVRLLDEALDMGITHFDTAPLYGDGSAEEALGRAFSKKRDSVTLATKFGLVAKRWLGRMGTAGLPFYLTRSALARRGWMDWPQRCFDTAKIADGLTESLTILRTDYVDIFFLHEPRLQDLQNSGKFLERLIVERNAGRIRHIGLAGGELEPILSYYGDIFDVIQADEGSWEGRSLAPDITYSSISSRRDLGATEAIARALSRRPTGALLFGTHRIDHLRESADLLKTPAAHARL